MSKKKYLLPIFMIVAVDVLGLTIVIPLLPFYAQKFGASASQVGYLISTYAVFQLLAGPFLGSLSDRFGRRPILLISQIGTFIGFLVLARANALWVVFLARIIDGSTAGNISVAQAYLADVTEAKDRAKGFALIGISFGLGFFIGPWISGELAQYGYTYPIFAAAFLSFLSILGTFFLLPEPPTHAVMEGEAKLSVSRWSQYRTHLQNPKLRSYLFQFLCFTFAFSLFFSGFPLFAQRRLMWNGHFFGPKEVGQIYAYSGFLGILIQGGVVARVVRAFGEVNVAIFGFFMAFIGYIILGGTYTVPILVLSATVSAFGTATIRPTLTALISRNAARNEQGMMLGLTQSINSISQIAAPMVAGLMIEHGLLSHWAFLAGAITLIGLSLLIGAKKNAVKLAA